MVSSRMLSPRCAVGVCVSCLLVNIACLAWLSHLHGELNRKIQLHKSDATAGDFIVELHRVEAGVERGVARPLPTPCDCPECKAEREAGPDADAWRQNAEDPADLLPVPEPTLEPNEGQPEAKSSPHWSPLYRAPVSAVKQKNRNKDSLLGQFCVRYRHIAVT